MVSFTLDAFLAKHGLGVGDKIIATWKNTHVEGTILPQTSGSSPFLHIKLASGYNTGLGIEHISAVQKEKTPTQTFDTFSPQEHVEKKSANKHPQLSLITAGGTIGSKVDYKKAGTSPLMSSEEIVGMIPEIGEFAQFGSIVSPFSKLSGKMEPEDWIQLAHACEHELNKPEIKGVLLTHGTDTLHYTAAALSFMLRGLHKPLVLVGAQRSSDRGSSDTQFNLISACHVALSDMAEVGICMHETTSDDTCIFTRGTKVRKMHSSRRDAFRPINDIPLARITPHSGEVKMLQHATPRRENGKVELDAVFEKNIALIKVYPGMPKELLEFYAQRGVKGIILEATGLGHTHTDLHPTIQHLTQKGVPVFVTTQTMYGRVNLNVYSYGRQLLEAGAVGLEDMLPEVAYVKLGWVLAHTRDPAKVREMMLTPYAGEITPQSRVDAFLN